MKKFTSRLLRKYKLTLHNENKLENVLGFYISPLWVIISLIASMLMVCFVIYMIISFTPVGEIIFDQEYKAERKSYYDKFVSQGIAIDSLEQKVRQLEQYSANIKNIIGGNIVPNPIDTTLVSDTLYTEEHYPIDASDREKEFAEEFERNEQYNLITSASSVGNVKEMFFYRPVNGMVIKSFDLQKGHHGIDIAENPGEPIVAIMEGTVVLSDYTAGNGYTIVIMHREDLVSIYRNCHNLLKKVGDKVASGEAIASYNMFADGAETNKYKPFLHLELWHKGEPLDPSIYISF